MFTSLLQLVAPAECLGCDRTGSYICQDCLANLPSRPVTTCYNCNRLSPAGRTCPTCRRQSYVRGVTVAQRYEGLAKALVHQMKYQSAAELARPMAKSLVAALPATDFDLIIPVPAAPGRQLARGYNPAAKLAQGVATSLALPCLDILGRLSEGHQVGHSRQERLRALTGQIYSRPSSLLAGARILLIDDVITTGATMNECAKVLREVGVKSVWGGAFAKH